MLRNEPRLAVLEHLRLAGPAVLWMSAGVLLAGCGGPAATVDRSEMQVAFQITNDAGGPDFMTVWLVSDLGDTELLGTVPTGETEVFRYGPVGPGPGRYRLVGQETGEETVVSNTFNLSGDAVVQWDTSSEIVDVSSVTPPEMP